MPLETATYINQLVSSNPAGTDSEGQGADHLRLIKSTIQATLPNVTGAITLTQAQVNAGKREAPLGSIQFFPLDPGSGAGFVARGGTAIGTEKYIECDGSTYPNATFPDLAASGLVSSGSVNFVVPHFTDTGRFLRSRVPSVVSPGTYQSSQNLSHAHSYTDSGHTHTAADSGHTHTATSTPTDPGHLHTTSFGPDSLATAGWGGNGGNPNYVNPGAAGTNTTTSTTGITVSTSVASGTANVTNSTNVTNIVIQTSGGSEARPEAYTGLYVITV